MVDPRQEIRALPPAERREMVARELGAQHDGVARLDELYELGLTYDQVLAETTAVLAMSVQQRIVLPRRLLREWESTQRHRRGALLSEAIPLVCDGAHALGELDFARACRRHGLPEPSRQTPRHTDQGLVYLDVWFDDYGVHAEINGAQHYTGLGPVADARRRNDRTLACDLTIEIPVLGLLVERGRLPRAGGRGPAPTRLGRTHRVMARTAVP